MSKVYSSGRRLSTRPAGYNLAPVTGPIHLQPTAPLAPRVLLPGDPARALLLAQSLLDAPKMFNHHRGLWGYSGTATDGELLTIQSTGMGGPSAAIVISELADLGVTTMLRVGTCGALVSDLELGELIVAAEAIGDDGTSRALGVGDRVPATPALLHALVSASGARGGPVVSTDLFYDDPRQPEPGWVAAGALAVEMETATLFALAARRGFEAASLLVVSDLLTPERVRIGSEELRAAEHEMGDAALQGLTALARAAGAAQSQ
jgi:DeoD family purine-nucleoside phosphorylase